MVITGTVIDETKDTALPGASIVVVDGDAQPLGPGTSADENGEFLLDSVKLPGNFILISHVGHMTIMAESDLFNAMDYPIVALPAGTTMLDDVIVTGKRKSKFPLWLIPAFALLLLAGMKRRKKVGSIGADDWKGLAMKAGIAVAIYYLVIKPVLVKLGILESREDAQVNKDRLQALKDAAQVSYQQQAPTYTTGELSGFADSLFESMRYSWIDDDYDDTEAILSKMRNTSDVYKTIEYFGERDECFFGVICSKQTLPEMVKRNLSTSRLQTINKLYVQRGIKFSF